MRLFRDMKRFYRLTSTLPLVFFLAASGCATVPSEPAEDQSVNIQEAVMRGDSALRSNRLDEALVEYVKVLNWDSTDVDSLYKVAYIHSVKNNTQLAHKSYTQVLALDKNHQGAIEGLGLLLLRNGKYDAAEQRLTQAIGLNAHLWKSHNGLGVIYDMKTDYSRAKTHYLAALKEQPGSSIIFNNFGYSRYLAGSWNAAQSYFYQALANDPKNDRAWSNLGLLRTRKKDYDKALYSFLQIMEKPQALNNLGYLCMLDRKYEQAEKYFLKAIKASPSYYEVAHENLVQSRRLASINKDLSP